MYPQRLRATATALPHPDGRKQTCAFNKKDAQIGEKDFSHANRVRMQSPSPCLQRRMGGLLTRTSTCPVGLEVRIQIPQHPFAFLATLDSRGPFPAKTNLVHPVPHSKSRY